MTISGIINLDKQPGKTSFQMVALVRRLTGQKRVGHAGTLDPDATGVLPILIGQATRLARFLSDSVKVYRAEIRFGSSTATYDSSGEITRQGDTDSLTREQVEAALDSFRGLIQQTPPMYSALKRQGQPLYQLARAGIEVPRAPRTVNISRLEVLDWRIPSLTIEVECSKGTYIRSLAHDLGEALGCGAHLAGLTRLQVGPFHLNEAVSVVRLEETFRDGGRENLILPLDSILDHLPAVVVDEEAAAAIANGRPFSLASEQKPGEGQYRAYSTAGTLLALVRFDQEAGLWRPEQVFSRGITGSG